MTGAPRDAYEGRDFVRVPLAVVDVVGWEAAVVFCRIAYRCRRGGSWEGTHQDLQAETRLTEHKVKRAVRVLRDAGWVTSHRADPFRARLTWQVCWEGVDAGQDEAEDSTVSGGCPSPDQEAEDFTVSPFPQEVEEEHHAAGVVAEAQEDPVEDPDAPALFVVPDPPAPVREGPPKTAQTLVARWCDGYRAANGEDAPKAFMGRVAGQARNLAKACGDDHGEWVAAYNASFEAGQAGHADMTRHLVRTRGATTSARRNVLAETHLQGRGADFLSALSAPYAPGLHHDDPPRQIGPAR